MLKKPIFKLSMEVLPQVYWASEISRLFFAPDNYFVVNRFFIYGVAMETGFLKL